MKATAKLAVIALFACPAAFAEHDRPGLPMPIASAEKAALPPGSANAPWQGESLKFSLDWGLIAVGSAEMDYDTVINVDGVLCHHLVTKAKSNGFVDTFFRVRDQNDTCINVKDRTSRFYAKKIREGSYLWDEWVMFDQPARKYKGQQKDRAGNITPLEGTLPGDVQDILSALYYVRSGEMAVGKDIVFDVNTTKNWPLVVKVLRRETVKVPAGKFDCFVIRPEMRDKGIFVQKGKSLTVWVTADDKRMPVKMQAEVFIGNVSAELESYSRK